MLARFGALLVLLLGAFALAACSQTTESPASASPVVADSVAPSDLGSATSAPSEEPSVAASSAEACVPSDQVDLLLDNFDSISNLSAADVDAIVASFEALNITDPALADWRDQLVANLESGNQQGMASLNFDLLTGTVGLGGVTC